MEKNNYDKAIEDYSQAIQINPKLAEAHNSRGIAYEKKGGYDKAIEDYSQAIQINSKYYDAYNNRGMAYYDKGEYEKAVADYTQVIRINTKNNWIYNNRGMAYHAKGEYDKAIDDYNTAIQINPKYVWAYNNISRLLATCPDAKYRNGTKAIEFAQKATGLDPNGCDYWDTLAAAYAESGKFEDAEKTQEKAIEMLNEKDKDKKISEYTEHLNFYKAKKPWHEKPKSGNQK